MRKGQGLPLNVIIIAIIVLVVLVILIAIFSGNIILFEQGLSREQAQLELRRYQPSYGVCHPSASEEQSFLSKLGTATKSGDVNEQAAVRGEFQDLIGECSGLSETNCRGGCTTVAVS